MTTEKFHFVDLLSLHLRARLDHYETRGLLPLMQWHSGLPLPALAFYPPPVVELLRTDLHRQHPWLANLQLPRVAFGPRSVDWAPFWAWVDVAQRRTCAVLNLEPDAFEVEPIDPEKIPAPTFIIIAG